MFSLLGILMASFHNGVCMYVYFGRFKMTALKVYIYKILVFIHNYVLCICYCRLCTTGYSGCGAFSDLLL